MFLRKNCGNYRSRRAGFKTCRIADFQIGQASDFLQQVWEPATQQMIFVTTLNVQDPTPNSHGPQFDEGLTGWFDQDYDQEHEQDYPLHPEPALSGTPATAGSFAAFL